VHELLVLALGVVDQGHRGLRKARDSITTGIKPTSTMARLGKAASPSRSSRARLKATTARVSALNGRSTKVAGSSFITSTNTNNSAAKALRRSSGMCSSHSTRQGRAPSSRAVSSTAAGTRA
jgi:hypothetical protein